MFALLRFTVTLCLVVGLSWAFVSLPIDGRTPAEHAVDAGRTWAARAAAAGRSWATRAATAAADRARDLVQRAWDEIAAVSTGRDPAPEVPPAPSTGAPAPAEAPPVEVARERVVRLEAAERELRADPAGPTSPPDRPASSRERAELERRLGGR